jgi:hypothetical protein
MRENATRALIGVAAAFAVMGSVEGFADQGRPVTEADLSGKKVCWENGRVSTYAANFRGSNESNNLSWSVLSPGLVKSGYKYRQMEVFPDGHFEIHIFKGRRAKGLNNIQFWGTVCN